jgi:HSP20 family protein
MSTMVRWDPFRELHTLRDEMNRVFARTVGDRPSGGAAAAGAAWAPPVDILDTAEAFVIKAELPGLRPEDVEVELDEDVLSIRGERRFEEDVEEGRYHRIERAYGAFARTLHLPQGVRQDDISATFTDGVLEVRVPKAEEVRPRRISVETPGQ